MFVLAADLKMKQEKVITEITHTFIFVMLNIYFLLPFVPILAIGWTDYYNDVMI